MNKELKPCLEFYNINTGEAVPNNDYFVLNGSEVWQDNYEYYESQCASIGFEDCIVRRENIGFRLVGQQPSKELKQFIAENSDTEVSDYSGQIIHKVSEPYVLVSDLEAFAPLWEAALKAKVIEDLTNEFIKEIEVAKDATKKVIKESELSGNALLTAIKENQLASYHHTITVIRYAANEISGDNNDR